ncbi:hypothetical protein CMS1097 [Clavibacter sepedonicus]|uniref:Secreted protein n=2 Tax=Microbacteriaceae TaxID=85023 RepID=B0RGF5_CLASE|nr:hypothetical protein CMS1097 [Clavibacter sepedonicus]
MKKQLLTQVAAVAVLAMSSFAVTPSVYAEPSASRTPSKVQASMSHSNSAQTTHASILRDSAERRELASDLTRGPADRTTATTPYGQRVTYHLSGHALISFTYTPNGDALVDPGSEGGPGESLVGVGADPFPYISLDSSEQAAGAVGAARTIALAVCAAVGPETAGVGCGIGAGLGATVIGILTAHGICPGGQNLRIYLATLAAQCRHY